MQKTFNSSGVRAVKAPQNSMPAPLAPPANILPPEGFSSPVVLPPSVQPSYTPTSPSVGGAPKIFSPLDEPPLESVGMRPSVLPPPGAADEGKNNKDSDLDGLNFSFRSTSNSDEGGLNKHASGIKDMIMHWCKSRTRDYKDKGVNIENFSTSWNDGMAFCALIHHFYPEAFDFDKLNPKNRRHNFDLAFRMFSEKAGVAALLDVDDMVAMKKPDWKCVFTYIQSIYKALG